MAATSLGMQYIFISEKAASQVEVFENSIDKMDTSSEIFIRRFMKSEVAKRLDNESVLESNIQANDILELINEEYGISNY